MKLLMITRKVDKNDALAGFVYTWVEKLAENLDKLYVITWQKGDSSGLPSNVEVKNLSGFKIFKLAKLKILTFKYCLKKIDGVFCHMNPEYTIVSGTVARILGKKVVSWYTHRSVTYRRRWLEIVANKIITASEKSFRDPLFKNKVKILGHGINTDEFTFSDKTSQNNKFNIISVGRISPTKDYESIIKALDILKDKNIKLKIVGDVILKEHKPYAESLKQMSVTMKLQDQVEFIGWVANNKMPEVYQQNDLFINMSGTGSVDKVVLEAMACKCLVLTSNEAFEDILPSELMIEKNNPRNLSEKINYLKNLPNQDQISLKNKLRRIVVENHNLDVLVKKIIKQFE